MPVYRIPVFATYKGFATVEAETQDEAISFIEADDWETIELDDPDTPLVLQTIVLELVDEDEDEGVLEVDEEFDSEDEDDDEDEDEEED